MRKTLAFIFIIFALPVFTACGSESGHEHMWGNQIEFDANEHWLSCTIQGCEEKAIESHDFQSVRIEEKPTSDFAGRETCVCRVCGALCERIIAKLPDRMPQNEWNELFSMDNVRIVVNTSGEDSVYEVTETVCKIVRADGIFYGTRDMFVKEIDFSSYYTEFSNNGDGTYTCENIVVNNNGLQYTINEAKIEIEDCKIAKMDIDATIGSMNLFTQYVFTNYGDVEIILPTLTEDELVLATNHSNFMNVTVQYNSFNKATRESIFLLKQYDNNAYHITDMINTDNSEIYGESENAVKETNPDLFEILNIIRAEKFAFDIASNRFAYSEQIELPGGIVIEKLFMVIDGEKIKSITIENGNMQSHYMFNNYGTTEVKIEG